MDAQMDAQMDAHFSAIQIPIIPYSYVKLRGFEAIRPPIMHKKAPFYNGALCVYATKIQ